MAPMGLLLKLVASGENHRKNLRPISIKAIASNSLFECFRVERWLKEELPTQSIEAGVPSRFVDFICIILCTNTNKPQEDCPSCPLNPKGLDVGWDYGRDQQLPRRWSALFAFFLRTPPDL